MSKISELYMMETEKESNIDDEMILREIREFLEKNKIAITTHRKGKREERRRFGVQPCRDRRRDWLYSWV